MFWMAPEILLLIEVKSKLPKIVTEARQSIDGLVDAMARCRPDHKDKQARMRALDGLITTSSPVSEHGRFLVVSRPLWNWEVS